MRGDWEGKCPQGNEGVRGGAFRFPPFCVLLSQTEPSWYAVLPTPALCSWRHVLSEPWLQAYTLTIPSFYLIIKPL